MKVVQTNNLRLPLELSNGMYCQELGWRLDGTVMEDGENLGGVDDQ